MPSVKLLDDLRARCIIHRTIQHVDGVDMSRFQHIKGAGHVVGTARTAPDEIESELTRRGVKCGVNLGETALPEGANSPSVSNHLTEDFKAFCIEFCCENVHAREVTAGLCHAGRS